MHLSYFVDYFYCMSPFDLAVYSYIVMLAHSQVKEMGMKAQVELSACMTLHLQ